MPKSTFFNLSDEKKQRIIEATYEEFSENEYDHVLVCNIAKRAEIPVGSFYQYFYDKDDLYLYLFFEMDLRIAKICREKNLNFVSLRNNVIKEYLNEKELKFYDTWYSVPVDVMRKFYFGEYDDRLFEICRKAIEKFQIEGKLIDYADIDFILYIYVTSTFNLYMYFKKYKIDDEVKRLELKDLFFEKILNYGILKKYDN